MKIRRMQEKEIKELFKKTEAQSGPDQKQVLKTYQYLQMEMNKEKYRAENETCNKIQGKDAATSILDILWRQSRLMDKTYIITYILAVIISFGVMVFLRRAGIEKDGAITVSMVLSGLLSTFTVRIINKLYFGKMAELGASCYFGTRMCAAAGLMITGAVNFIMIAVLAVYSGNIWEISFLQTGIYILTAYMISSLVNFRILLTNTGEKASIAMAAGTFFCSGGYITAINIPGALLSASIGIWAVVCAAVGILVIIQVRKLLCTKELLFVEVYHA
jgi:hypothetical protein